MPETIRIILISDAPDDEQAVRSQLVDAGYDVEIARSSTREEFVRLLNSFYPDVIISAYPFPGFTSWEPFILLEAYSNTTPFICISNAPEPEQAVDCLKAGASDYILRPHLYRLAPAVKSLLIKRRITREKECAESALRYRIAFDNLLVSLSNKFINLLPEEVGPGIVRALGEIAQFVNADRSYIFLFSEDGSKVTNAYEWCGLGIPPQKHRVQDAPVACFPWFMRRIKQMEVVHMPHVDSLPPEAGNEKKEFQAQGIQSILNVPLLWKGDVIGFLGFDAVRAPRAWPDEALPLLRIAGEMFANAIMHARAEQSLQESRQKYYALTEDANDAIMLLDLEGRVIEGNKKAQELLGYSREELAGMPIDKLAPESMVSRAQALFRNVIRSGRGVIEDALLCRKDGSTVEGDIAGSVIEYSGKKLVQGIFTDLTRQKEMERALRGKERFLENVFSSIQDGVSILDKDLTILSVNETLEKWHAYTLPLVGKKCYEAYHNRKEPCEICPTLKTLRTKKAAFEVIPKGGKNGKVVGWLELYSFPLFDHLTGELNGVIEYVRDISERRKVEMEREKLTRDLVKSNKRLKQLSLRDTQTGLYNHHFLAEVLESEYYRASRYGHSLSLIMLDIDYFKSVNDVYGHRFGDLVIKQFVSQLKKLVRRYDIIVRYDGESFVVLCPGTDRTKVLLLGQRLLDAVNLYNFGNKRVTVKLKMSVAVTSYPDDQVNKAPELIEHAEKIIEKVKEDGGNRVYSAQDVEKKSVRIAVAERQDVRSLKDQIDRMNRRAHRNFTEAIFGFAKTIELKDYYTGKHVESTVQYATEIAKGLRLTGYEVEMIRQASMLHDLGKIGISEKILLKKGKLSPREFEEIKKHPRIAVDILRPIHFFHSLIPLILYHHERWDGKGYPEGLKGEEIPMGARVVALADVYQALTSDRPYHRAFSREQAIDIIKEDSGKRFDPSIVEVFMRILTQG